MQLHRKNKLCNNALPCLLELLSSETALDQGLRTPDIKQQGDGCTVVGCREMGKVVADLVATVDVPVPV